MVPVQLERREQATAITNKAEAFHSYSEWLMVGGRLIGHNDSGSPGTGEAPNEAQ